MTDKKLKKQLKMSKWWQNIIFKTKNIDICNLKSNNFKRAAPNHPILTLGEEEGDVHGVDWTCTSGRQYDHLCGLTTTYVV